MEHNRVGNLEKREEEKNAESLIEKKERKQEQSYSIKFFPLQSPYIDQIYHLKSTFCSP